MLISSFTLAMSLYPRRRKPRVNRHRKIHRRLMAWLGF